MTTLDERVKEELKKRKDKFQEEFGNGEIWWKPEKDEELRGVVEDLGTEKTQFREDQCFIKINTGEKVFKVFCNQQLTDAVHEEDVSKGDYIVVQFLGERKSTKTGRTYKNYIMANLGGENKSPTTSEKTPKPKKESIFTKKE